MHHIPETTTLSFAYERGAREEHRRRLGDKVVLVPLPPAVKPAQLGFRSSPEG
jgi:hypothetical protein